MKLFIAGIILCMGSQVQALSTARSYGYTSTSPSYNNYNNYNSYNKTPSSYGNTYTQSNYGNTYNQNTYSQNTYGQNTYSYGNTYRTPTSTYSYNTPSYTYNNTSHNTYNRTNEGESDYGWTREWSGYEQAKDEKGRQASLEERDTILSEIHRRIETIHSTCKGWEDCLKKDRRAFMDRVEKMDPNSAVARRLRDVWDEASKNAKSQRYPSEKLLYQALSPEGMARFAAGDIPEYDWKPQLNQQKKDLNHDDLLLYTVHQIQTSQKDCKTRQGCLARDEEILEEVSQKIRSSQLFNNPEDGHKLLVPLKVALKKAAAAEKPHLILKSLQEAMSLEAQDRLTQGSSQPSNVSSSPQARASYSPPLSEAEKWSQQIEQDTARSSSHKQGKPGGLGSTLKNTFEKSIEKGVKSNLDQAVTGFFGVLQNQLLGAAGKAMQQPTAETPTTPPTSSGGNAFPPSPVPSSQSLGSSYQQGQSYQPPSYHNRVGQQQPQNQPQSSYYGGTQPQSIQPNTQPFQNTGSFYSPSR